MSDTQKDQMVAAKGMPATPEPHGGDLTINGSA
jgi:hypothetical protein